MFNLKKLNLTFFSIAFFCACKINAMEPSSPGHEDRELAAANNFIQRTLQAEVSQRIKTTKLKREPTTDRASDDLVDAYEDLFQAGIPIATIMEYALLENEIKKRHPKDSPTCNPQTKSS